MEPTTATKSAQPPSPTRSDKSSESEGRPVREKLKETRIDAHASSDQTHASDQPMNDAPTNGTRGDNSTSGSESERGRLRRKRSREDFEDDHEDAKHPEKKHERHTRKKSRDVTSPKDLSVDLPAKPTANSVPAIREHDSDEAMHAVEPSAEKEPTATGRQTTPDPVLSDKDADALTSPKNKRTLDQVEATTEEALGPTPGASKDSIATTKVNDERDTKRPRDGVALETATSGKNNTKIPTGSGFANTSSISPFATMAPKPQTSTTAGKPAEKPVQTSEEAFKSSGFGSFAKSTASPFAIGSSGSASPFAAAAGNKLSSFASKPASSSSAPSGFAALGNSTSPSVFGGTSTGTSSTFGGAMTGSGFGSLSGAKLTSFGSGSGITGLKGKSEKPFGSSEEQQESDDDGDDDGEDGKANEDEEHTEHERRRSQSLLQAQGPPETGEENENTVWTGRAKLYTLAGETGKKEWHERGLGPFKLNVTRDAPTRARFVLRADGTHRLLLNAAVTSNMRFGDARGEKPQDGKLLFTAPTSTGEVESHLLKLRPERAMELWSVVNDLKTTL